MVRLKDAELNQLSASFAGRYVEQKFARGGDIEKQQVLNYLAHGFYMGAREAEKKLPDNSRSFWWWTFKAPKWAARGIGKENSLARAMWLDHESLKAANFYIKKQGFYKVIYTDQALVRATVSIGFKAGFNHLDVAEYSES